MRNTFDRRGLRLTDPALKRDHVQNRPILQPGVANLEARALTR